MIKQVAWGTLAGLSLLLGVASGGTAAEMPEGTRRAMPGHSMETEETGFQRIEQPLSSKAAVTLGGFGLIGLELWWFLFSKPKARQATASAGVQEVTVTVDGGYEPSQIVVRAGQPVRLKFDRRDPSSCLEEIRFPDFRIAQTLPLNQVTAIEFTPSEPGDYTFTCGMNMFRGTVKVEAAQPSQATAAVPAEKQAGIRSLEGDSNAFG